MCIFVSIFVRVFVGQIRSSRALCLSDFMKTTEIAKTRKTTKTIQTATNKALSAGLAGITETTEITKTTGIRSGVQTPDSEIPECLAFSPKDSNGSSGKKKAYFLFLWFLCLFADVTQKSDKRINASFEKLPLCPFAFLRGPRLAT